MSVADKLTTIAENVPKVYNKGLSKGKQTEYDCFWDAYQENGTKTDYDYAFSGSSWRKIFDLRKPKYPITPMTAEGIFYWFNYDGDDLFDLSEICSLIDFSNLSIAKNIFYRAKVKNITCDFSNCTQLFNTFAAISGGKYDNITLKVTEKCTSYQNTFVNTNSITTLIFTSDSVINGNLDVKNNYNLTHDSLMSIINCLIDNTSSGTKKTLTINDTNKGKLTAEELAVAEKKGWTVK